MKTHCKNVNIRDIGFIVDSILDFMDRNKCEKAWSRRIFRKFSGRSNRYVKEHLKPRDPFLEETAQLIAFEVSDAITRRCVREHIMENLVGQKVIRYAPINDSGSGKKRTLGIECAMLKIYENLFRYAAEPLFEAKVGTYQVASIKGKGQSYGVKAVKKWISGDVEGTKFGGQMDITKCYPSIPHSKILSMLDRDIHKNNDMVYLIHTIFGLYEEFPDENSLYPSDHGILIGSPASKDLCNYYLSSVYHYASEQLAKVSTRRGKTKRVRLISHILIYMDDILIYGPNKKDIHTAVRLIIEFCRKELGVRIKDSWSVFRTAYVDRNGKRRGRDLDFMGVVFHGGAVSEKQYPGERKRHKKVWVTIRDSIFLRSRRKLARLSRKVRKGDNVSVKLARGVTAQYGSFVNSNSYQIRRRYVDGLLRVARRIVSDYEKGKGYEQNKYYKLWRIAYA